MSFVMIRAVNGRCRSAISFPAQSHFSVSSRCPRSECVSQSCKTLPRSQRLSALTSINQIKYDSSLSAVQSPHRTPDIMSSQVPEHGTRFPPCRMCLWMFLCSWCETRARTGHQPNILLTTAQLHTDLMHTDGLLCLINKG